MRLKFIHILCGLFLVFDACVEPFDVPLPDNRSYVIVDGLITDQPGPYNIRLFRPSSLSDQLTTVNWITKASLTIKDDEGNAYPLAEATPGNYQTPGNFQGVVGRTYTLQISISDDEQYESLPQTMLPVGEIEKVYYEFVQVQDVSDANMTDDPKNGFNIYLDGKVLPEQNKMVRWRTSGTFEILTFPQDKKTAESGPRGTIVMVPAPPPCSGFRYNARTNSLTRVGDCTCCTCWPTLYDKTPLLSDPKFLNNDEVVRQKLAFIPANRAYFRNKYYFQVEQMSVTPEAYAFWNVIRKQEGSGSDLFQTPAARTTGNMRPVGDTQTPIIGLFGVSAIRTNSFFIDRSEVPYALLPMNVVEESCVLAPFGNSTNVKPFFWQ